MEEQNTQRPVLATVVAIVGLIFGLIGLCAGPASLSIYFIDIGPNPAVDVIRGNQILFFYTIAAGVMGIFLTLIEILGCVGLLMMKPWGRAAVMFYSVAAMLLLIVGISVNAIFLLPPLPAVPSAA
jgi:hypothetical protein